MILVDAVITSRTSFVAANTDTHAFFDGGRIALLSQSAVRDFLSGGGGGVGVGRQVVDQARRDIERAGERESTKERERDHSKDRTFGC